MGKFCTKCGKSLEEGAKFCVNCGTKTEEQPTQAPAAPAPPPSMQGTPGSGIWYQNNYRIRKKVLTIWNKYWIEDPGNNLLGFSKQKMLKLKEDIRIYTDESMNSELFAIKQEQIFDAWGTFAIIDTNTNTTLGFIRRGFLSEFGRDAWEMQDANRRPVGRIFETSLGRALARKYMPGGGLVPEKMTVELDGKPIAEINQEFKIIGDIWNINCIAVPPTLDRRVMLSCALLMGMIERDRK
jgi:hypothetical protein